MEKIVYINRETGKEEVEKVYGEKALKFLYGNDALSKYLGTPLLHALCKYPYFSQFYGWWQQQGWTKGKIAPFIEKFGIDSSEFAEAVEHFNSFNDFFIRKLHPNARPFPKDSKKAIIPADGRFLFYPEINRSEGFLVKGQKFNLVDLLQDEELAKEYEKGSMVMGRLCPTDYHRFHFPCEGLPSIPKWINGWLYSVNPVALKKNIHIFTQNKRCITEFASPLFGKILYLEIGATSVGSIHETFVPEVYQQRGAEKGYFSFGGSSLILLFLPGKIRFDSDLIEATKKGLEIRCLFGQSLGHPFAS